MKRNLLGAALTLFIGGASTSNAFANFYVGAAGSYKKDAYNTSGNSTPNIIKGSSAQVSAQQAKVDAAKKERDDHRNDPVYVEYKTDLKQINSEIAKFDQHVYSIERELKNPELTTAERVELEAQKSAAESHLKYYNGLRRELLSNSAYVELRDKDAALNAVYNEENSLLTNLTEGKTIVFEKSASGGAFGLSALAGYKHVASSGFMFGLEGVLETSNSSIGSGGVEWEGFFYAGGAEVKASDNFGAFLVGRVGFESEKLAASSYLNLGYGVKRKTLEFTLALAEGNLFSDQKKSQYIPFFVVGIGGEKMLTQNIGLFTELNHYVSTQNMVFQPVKGTGVKERFGFTSTELKIGARYYFI